MLSKRSVFCLSVIYLMYVQIGYGYGELTDKRLQLKWTKYHVRMKWMQTADSKPDVREASSHQVAAFVGKFSSPMGATIQPKLLRILVWDCDERCHYYTECKNSGLTLNLWSCVVDYYYFFKCGLFVMYSSSA